MDLVWLIRGVPNSHTLLVSLFSILPTNIYNGLLLLSTSQAFTLIFAIPVILCDFEFVNFALMIMFRLLRSVISFAAKENNAGWIT